MIKARMRYFFLALIVMAPPAVAAASEKPREPPKNAEARPPVTKGNPCAMYGAGFVMVEGTSTCVKIGGHLSIDVGGSVR
jgi:hypothetical protein